MDFEEQIKDWIKNDIEKMEALQAASTLHLNEWCIAAGFVRNMVWDKLHKKESITPLNDVDLIFYDTTNPSEKSDKLLERHLNSISVLPWSVKNQARMHVRNRDKPYTSICDAMSYWVEMETAVGVTLSMRGEIEILAPFGVARLFENSITINNKRRKADDVYERIKKKQWLLQWPNLKVSA
jgi:hypothetical protein